MNEKQRIEESRSEFRRLSDRKGLVARLTDAKRPNVGRPLEPLVVREFFLEAHEERKAVLDKAVDKFWGTEE